MTILLNDVQITTEDIRSGKSLNNLDDHEAEVINLLRQWYGKEDSIEFQTSGSTGKPKIISLTKDQMKYSAVATMDRIDPDREISHSILCISPSFIGGAMLVIRSVLSDLDLFVQKPGALPEISHDRSPLISLVPYQIMKSLDSDIAYFDSVHTLLIGGATLPDKYVQILKSRQINAYLTYGMTETSSHIALRHVRSATSDFEVIGQTQISTDERGCLMIRGTVTNNQWLQTNDIVKIKGPGMFEWVGRADLVINSGGFKVSPEPIENFLMDSLKKQVLILPEHDEILGQKVILLIESENHIQLDESIFESFHPYARPKKIQFVKSFVYTATGKVDRSKTANKYLR